METIIKYLPSLIFVHDCVIVPGFGAFVSNYAGATQTDLNYTFYPPKKNLIFNKNLSYNDGLLANYVAKNAKISYQTALERINTDVQRALLTLERDKTITLDGIGAITVTRDGHWEFIQNFSENYLTESYGLSPFRFPPLSYQKQGPVSLPHKLDQAMSPGMKQTLKWAAIALPVIGVFTLLPWYQHRHQQIAGISLEQPYPADRPIEQTHSAIGPESEVDSAIMTTTDKRTALFYSEPDKTTPTSTEASLAKQYYIIAGSFKDDLHANQMANDYAQKGYQPQVIQRDNLYRVSLCTFDNKVNALHELRRIRQKEQNDNVWIFAEK